MMNYLISAEATVRKSERLLVVKTNKLCKKHNFLT